MPTGGLGSIPSSGLGGLGPGNSLSSLTSGVGQAPGGAASGGLSSGVPAAARSEEHTSELQSRLHLVCRLLLEKKKNDVAAAQASQGKTLQIGQPDGRARCRRWPPHQSLI